MHVKCMLEILAKGMSKFLITKVHFVHWPSFFYRFSLSCGAYWILTQWWTQYVKEMSSWLRSCILCYNFHICFDVLLAIALKILRMGWNAWNGKLFQHCDLPPFFCCFFSLTPPPIQCFSSHPLWVLNMFGAKQ